MSRGILTGHHQWAFLSWTGIMQGGVWDAQQSAIQRLPRETVLCAGIAFWVVMRVSQVAGRGLRTRSFLHPSLLPDPFPYKYGCQRMIQTRSEPRKALAA